MSDEKKRKRAEKAKKKKTEEDFIKKAKEGKPIPIESYEEYIRSSLESDSDSAAIVIPSGTSYFGYDDQHHIGLTGTSSTIDATQFTSAITEIMFKDLSEET